jgi:hypothetical protein
LLPSIVTVQQFGTEENMYNKKDIENAVRANQVPSGMVDETDFVNTLQQVNDLLKETDFTTTAGRMTLGLKLINLACGENDEVDTNKAINVIISMSSHIAQLISTLSSLKGLDMKKYFDNYQEEFLNALVEKPILPYYDE